MVMTNCSGSQQPLAAKPGKPSPHSLVLNAAGTPGVAEFSHLALRTMLMTGEEGQSNRIRASYGSTNQLISTSPEHGGDRIYRRHRRAFINSTKADLAQAYAICCQQPTDGDAIEPANPVQPG